MSFSVRVSGSSRYASALAFYLSLFFVLPLFLAFLLNLRLAKSLAFSFLLLETWGCVNFSCLAFSLIVSLAKAFAAVSGETALSRKSLFSSHSSISSCFSIRAKASCLNEKEKYLQLYTDISRSTPSVSASSSSTNEHRLASSHGARPSRFMTRE